VKPQLHVKKYGQRAKALAVLGVSVAAVSGLALAQATPALADPTEHYVAVGSDTTENVMDQFAIDVNGNAVGSYDAVDPVYQAGNDGNTTVSGVNGEITPTKATGPEDCSFSRPDGSGQGVNALIFSIDQSSQVTQLPVPPQANCVDIARSSSAPGNNQSNSGQLVYIPFALDAVAGATGPATAGTIGGVSAVASQITTANQFTLTDLVNLYKNCANVTEGGVTYNPNTATAGQQQIDLYVPQSGSGTRNFWSTTLGFNATTLPSCVHDTIVNGADKNDLVEENDGTAVATDPDGYGPFSISQWISQRNGHDDRRHGAVENDINAISPFSNGNASTGALNTAYPVTREVYNVVQYSRVATGGANFDAGLAALLVGTGSALCKDTFQIESYGFAPLSASTTDECGSIATSLRAYATV